MDSKLLQNYRALRQLTWIRHHGNHSYVAPRFTAIGAYRQAIEDTLNGKERHPSSMPLYFGSWQTEGYRSPSDRAYYMDSFPWRNLGNVGEIRDESCYRGRPVDHTGWFTTDDGYGDTVYGVVLQLPARNGKPYFMPGIQWSGQDGVTCYPLDRYEEMRDCARAADRIAERLAEEERDYQRAWRAGVNAAQHQDNAIKIRREIMQIISDLRIARRAISPEIDGGTEEDNALLRLCDLARSNVRRLLADLHSEREERDKLRDEYGNEQAFIETYEEGV